MGIFTGKGEFGEFAAMLGGRRAILGWISDGTLGFATADDRAHDLEWQERLAVSYQREFSAAPELVAAIDKAYQGERAGSTVRLKDRYWDVRLWPVFRSQRLGGVVGLFSDATERITACRTVKTLELLSTLRYRLARSESPNEFLASCCKAIDSFETPNWIAVADHGPARALRVITGEGISARWCSGLDLSWDVGKKNGRHPPGAAVRTGRVQVERNVRAFHEGEQWIDPSLPWSGLLAIPLRGNDEFSGVLVIHGNEDHNFDDEVVCLWEQIAQEIAEGVELLRAKEKARHARLEAERRAAYLQYQRLFDTLVDIIVVHRDGRIIEMNPAGVKALGAQTSSDFIGAQVLALIDPADRDPMKEALRGEAGADDLRELRVLSLDGRGIDVEGITVSVLHNGQPARLSHWRNICERRRIEKLVRPRECDDIYANALTMRSGVVRCREDGSDWKALLTLFEQRIEIKE